MGKKILIVDDVPHDVLLTKKAMEECGERLEIEAVEDGLQALVRLHEKEFDLVLLDLKMPKVDGFEVLKFVRASPLLSSIPVVIQSGSDAEMDRTKAQELGSVDYVHKATDYKIYCQNLRHTLSRYGYC